MRLSIVVALFSSMSTLLADQVTIKNGDRITGSIVKKDAQVLTIERDVFGLVTIPWDQVQTLLADRPVHVVLSDGRAVQGTLTSKQQAVEIESSGGRQQLPSQTSVPYAMPPSNRPTNAY
jgi:small nuclear ribonucleoprotein (snRNP)-like protein